MSRRKGRPVDGVLLLNKPAGMTSNQALQRAKRLFFVEKAGHTGALDPLATGVLPLCFGEATKFSQFLLDADKGYRVCIQFGVTTDTCDADGEVLTEQSAADVTRERLEASFAAVEEHEDRLRLRVEDAVGQLPEDWAWATPMARSRAVPSRMIPFMISPGGAWNVPRPLSFPLRSGRVRDGRHGFRLRGRAAPGSGSRRRRAPTAAGRRRRPGSRAP